MDLLVDGLPEQYDQARLQDVLQSTADQVSASLYDLSKRATASPTAKSTPILPSESDAVLLSLAPHVGMDRWVTMASTGVVGPGRILKATGTSLPAGTKPPTGPTRYRAIGAGQRLGVLWARLTDVLPIFEIRYGFVVTGIRHWLGKVPTGLIAAGYLGDAPVADASVFDDGGNAALWNNPKRLFHDHAEDLYTTTGMPFASSFGTDATLAPSATDIATCRGITFSLITGRDQDEVYQQLNSLRVLGRALREQGHGSSVATPDGLALVPASPANVLNWNGAVGAGARYDHGNETQDLSTFTRLIQGCPFIPDDCGALVPSSTSFSLVVQADFTRVVTPGGGATWSSPEEWQNNGLVTDGLSPREWGVDVVVY